jgi:TfoX/Sxy family transcriptional regulator of competence genes
MPGMPTPSETTKELFRAVMPEDGRVTLRPMFGQLAGFVNGNMFSGIFGEDIFVRLRESERLALLKEKGATLFAPMDGRPMKEYVVLPAVWLKDAGHVREWVVKAMEGAAELPGKVAKPTAKGVAKGVAKNVAKKKAS